MDNKTLKLRPNTGLHDLETLIRHAEKFLTKGDRVSFICQFRGRENTHPQNGEKQLSLVKDKLNPVASVERDVIKKGNFMTLTLIPKKK